MRVFNRNLTVVAACLLGPGLAAFAESSARVVAVTDPDNEASKSVLLKSGFRYEGVRRAYASDCPGFRITRQQWLAEKA